MAEIRKDKQTNKHQNKQTNKQNKSKQNKTNKHTNENAVKHSFHRNQGEKFAVKLVQFYYILFYFLHFAEF